jgi:hypothetical protein
LDFIACIVEHPTMAFRAPEAKQHEEYFSRCFFSLSSASKMKAVSLFRNVRELLSDKAFFCVTVDIFDNGIC